VPFVVLTTPEARRDIAGLRGKPAARFVQRVRELRAQGCKAGGYRLTGYNHPWICCVHLYAGWRLLARFGDDDQIHILTVGEHQRGHREDVYRKLIELTGMTVPDTDAERTKPPCCGKPSEFVPHAGDVDEFIQTAKTVFDDRIDLEPFLSGDKEVEERIKRAHQ
jgi:hypothetical protein